MNVIVLLLFAALIGGSGAAIVFLRQPAGSPGRILASVGLCAVLFGLMAFCALGFLSSYELTAEARRPWQIGYAAAGLLAAAGAGLIGLHGFRKS